MFVQLVRHSFPDRPDWILISEHVPLGTRYEVMAYNRDIEIYNSVLKETRNIEVYFVKGNGNSGWLPKICFETIEYSEYSTSSLGN